MSDGNFNRALLPHTPYASGLKAGKQIAKMHAVETLRQVLTQYQPDLLKEVGDSMVQTFEKNLSIKLK